VFVRMVVCVMCVCVTEGVSERGREREWTEGGEGVIIIKSVRDR
jgi:hypothetical protein